MALPKKVEKSVKLHNICMVSDFFYPNTGGVEEHIYNLSQCLLKRGHKVIVITHSYGDRAGIRYMTCGLKVYYLPMQEIYGKTIFLTMVASIPLVRYIFIREKVEIVHNHSAFSALGHDVAVLAKLVGLKTVFTDHSLFGFADLSAVVTNKIVHICLCMQDQCICVSHTGKENTVLRGRVPADQVSVIPNAVDSYAFTPEPLNRDDRTVTIVIVSRLVYRKGVDLMAAVIADMCPRYPQLRFLVGGDGPKMWLLQQVRERRGLQHCVTLLGNVDHSQVRDVLTKGHIFLNTSLTEAYCMAIVEAAACGLPVVSTRVGGIPEVLPESLIYLTEPNVTSIVDGIERAMCDLAAGKNLCPYECNKLVREMYSWVDITRRTEIVYNRAMSHKIIPVGKQLKRYLGTGAWQFLLLFSLMYLIVKFFERFHKRKNIDIVRDYIPVK